ncbi:FAD-binding domain-containing protein [Basidiobolus meristosporus CBS 931.73]|uniref:FAD-binding domain-containing protein n=1 Tax=Basidiobolus meristosporus CBS 931.73 TaxID=1314790 RepID=A0A1Y1X4D8_9FUNG|nr:FAD-binding domain-containing protein [Basidiobolus meristosporus CBS 931.73]|eukprot:ORX80226.1 FAD-binding domain-containing protein [Basidiobolus meristosporus CBS 931.73]
MRVAGAVHLLSLLAAAAQLTLAQESVFSSLAQNATYRSQAEFYIRDGPEAQHNKYLAALKFFNNLYQPEELPKTALPLAILKLHPKQEYDLSWLVEAARVTGIKISARSGGYHSAYASVLPVNGVKETPREFVLVDLSSLKGITIDPKRKIAVVEPGVTGSELYDATAKYGLHFPGPHTSFVTIGGFLLQGGMGFGSRLLGAGVDNVVGFEIITSRHNGRSLYVDANNYPDLFYAVRGGGQFFGVITKFHLKVYPIVDQPALIPTYSAKTIKLETSFSIHDQKNFPAVLDFYKKFDPTAPKSVETKIVFIKDADANAQLLLSATSVAPFNSSASVTAALNEIESFNKNNGAFFESNAPTTYYDAVHGGDSSWSTPNLSYIAEDIWIATPLSDKVLKVISEVWAKAPSVLSSMFLNTGTWEAPSSSALGFDPSYSLGIYSTWVRNGDVKWDEANIQWLKDTVEALKPYTLGFYANEMQPRSDGDANYWRKCYQPDAWKKLNNAKAKWDSRRVFKDLQ